MPTANPHSSESLKVPENFTEWNEALAARLAKLEAARGAEAQPAKPRKKPAAKHGAGKDSTSKTPAGKTGKAS